jgi:hypothetical protein
MGQSQWIHELGSVRGEIVGYFCCVMHWVGVGIWVDLVLVQKIPLYTLIPSRLIYIYLRHS